MQSLELRIRMFLSLGVHCILYLSVKLLTLDRGLMKASPLNIQSMDSERDLHHKHQQTTLRHENDKRFYFYRKHSFKIRV